MRWVSHTLISGAICLVWAPPLTPAAVLGATAPDWLEWLGRKHLPLGRATHRGHTHNLLGWVCLMALGLSIPAWGRIVFAFAAGGALHWFCDALTVSGAPMTWWSQHRSTLFGGRLRQGSRTERGIAWAVALCCAWLFVWQHHSDSDRFTPYLMPWQAHYQNGLIDAAEWRLHRFSPF